MTRKRNYVEKVVPTADRAWADVTVRDGRGNVRIIQVRVGSMFEERPKPT